MVVVVVVVVVEVAGERRGDWDPPSASRVTRMAVNRKPNAALVVVRSLQSMYCNLLGGSELGGLSVGLI